MQVLCPGLNSRSGSPVKGASSALHQHGVIQAVAGAVSPTYKGSGQGLQQDMAPTSYMVTGKHCLEVMSRACERHF